MELLDFFDSNKTHQLGSAELIYSHKPRVADVSPHNDERDENTPYFVQNKTKFP